MRKILYMMFLGILVFCSSNAIAADAAGIYQQSCVKCHGADGRGQTTIGRKFKVKDFSDPSWQTQNPASKIQTSIENGVKDPAGKELMKAYRNELTPQEIQELVQYLQKFGASR